jgi:site-specific recombinase XerC
MQAWRTQQRKEKLATGSAWADSGLVFTRPDGTPLRPEWISQRFDLLIAQYAAVRQRHHAEGWSIERIARRHRIPETKVRTALDAGPLPPIRFHDLRHGSATLSLAGGVDLKVVSETRGHARSAFTADTCTSVIPELFKAAAEATAAGFPAASAPQRDQRFFRCPWHRKNRW